MRLILKGKSGKQHCLPFVGSNQVVEIFLKQREHQKRMPEIVNWGGSAYFVLGFQENSMQSLSAF